MEKRLALEIKTEKQHLFLQAGFFNPTSPTTTLHFHGYTEVHIIISGKITYIIDRTPHTYEAGDILAIPRKTYHRCADVNNAQSIAYQTEKSLDSLVSTHLSQSLIHDFFSEIKRAEQNNNYYIILKYISLFSSLLNEQKTVQPVNAIDYSLIINEFFANRYAEKVTIHSLAKELNLSEKQTARLVKKYTGNTFNQQLTLSRLNIANHLINSTNMTMGEIADYVGFMSYSGFWKAYKKQKKD